MAEATITRQAADATGGQANGSGIVEATERLHRSLFSAAIAFSLGSALWGLVIAPFNSFNDHHPRSAALGVMAVLIALPAFYRRDPLFRALRRRPALLLVPTLVAIAILWADGGWRSSFYLASYAPIALAAVVGNLRWSFVCAGLLAAGYVAGLAVNGYTWPELRELNDADSVVANTGGYLIAAFFFAAPVSWLGGYVARINQVIGASAGSSRPSPTGTDIDPPKPRGATAQLSVKEIQVCQLLTEGLTNTEIAERLYLSPRTVQSHVANAMRKTDARSRTGLAVLAVREGLVPTAGDPAPGSEA